MFTAWDILLLQESFKKLDDVNVVAHEVFIHAKRTGGRDCDAQQSSYISDGTDKRELLGKRADGLQVELGGLLTIISAHLLHKGKKL